MKRLALIPVCLAFVFAACGDDGDGASEPASGPAPSAETPAPEGDGGGASTGGGGGDAQSVAIKDFEYAPKDLSVEAGTEVEWTNEDSADHNVIFDGDTPQDIENLEQDQSGTVTFEEAGTFDYVCSYHPGMEGSVEVQ
jgi:plastocyanin